MTAGSQALAHRTVTFTWPGDQQITSAWGANHTQNGTSVALTDVSYDGSIAAGAAYTNIGFQGTWSAGDAAPTSVGCSSS